jgi:hypothetical protein
VWQEVAVTTFCDGGNLSDVAYVLG